MSAGLVSVYAFMQSLSSIMAQTNICFPTGRPRTGSGDGNIMRYLGLGHKLALYLLSEIVERDNRSSRGCLADCEIGGWDWRELCKKIGFRLTV